MTWKEGFGGSVETRLDMHLDAPIAGLMTDADPGQQDPVLWQ